VDHKKKNAKAHNERKKKLKRMCKAGRCGEFDDDDVDRVAAGASVDQLAGIVEALSLKAAPGDPPLTDEDIQNAQDLFEAAMRSLRSDAENAAADDKKASESVSREWDAKEALTHTRSMETPNA
jgi:hypothetical protein